MALIAGAMLIGGAASAYGSSRAADAQEDAARRAGQLSQKQFDQTANWLSPYRTMGDQAAGRISRVLGLGGAAPDMSEFQADPGYQFRLSEGNQALDRSAAGRGMLLSGAQLKAASRYNQGMASQEFGNWFNRLSGITDRGVNAATMTGNFGAQNAANQGNYLMAAGNAQAGNYINQANTIGNLASQGAGLYGMRTSGYSPPPSRFVGDINTNNSMAGYA